MEPTPAVTAAALYTGLLALLGLWLAIHVGRVRGATGVMMGDGGDPRMVRAMRGQANFVEVVPMALLLILAMAVLGAPAWLVHVAGIVLLAARVLHGLHFTREDAPGWQRGAGAGLSFLVLAALGVGVVGHALVRGF
jgi:uncharacterized membrane protein YecN with MAPEG domain